MKKVSLRTKFSIMMVATTAVLCAAAVFAAEFIYTSSLSSKYENLCKNVAQTILGFVTEDDVNTYLSGEGTVEYIETNNRIRNLCKSVPDILCIGVYRISDEGMVTVFDTVSGDVRGGLGTVSDYDRNWSRYKTDFIERQIVPRAEILEKSGMAVEYCMPIKGNKSAPTYVCVAVKKSTIDSEIGRFIKYNTMTLIAVTLFVLLLSIWLFERKIIKPVNKISVLVNHAANRSDNEFIHEIVDTHINTGNELENIYRSLLKIYTSKARLSSAAAAADETSASAIISLIKRMDNFTAAHLDNSLQYVILIVNELKILDKYKEKITDSFCNDIILASPLHDIGKLAIPDKIVGKPGKLTDEEYEIMKMHSELGAKIVEEMYLKNSNEPYLYMAREIALHHHERWDGGGYPHSLAGEDIPLEVRIVSIADVFDALVSERSYKEAYSFDKSFDIILQDRGTFFDPEIIDVLINAKEKMRAIHSRIAGKK